MNRVKVWSTKNCPNCERLKAILRMLKIHYSEKVLKGNDIAELIVNYNIYSTPALQLGDMLFEFRGDRNSKTETSDKDMS